MAADVSRRRPLARSMMGCALTFALLAAAYTPVSAASTSRTLGTGLFLVGIGVKMGGIVTGSDARASYDDYLTTADQSRLATLKEDVRSQRELSRSLSNTADGLIVAGALLAVYSVLRAGPGGPGETALLDSSIRMAPGRRSLALLWDRRF